jgi:hypothetical protein
MMIKNNIFLLFTGITLIFTASSCKDDDPSVKDHMLNFQVKEIPATHDYLIGATYLNPSIWNDADYEQPAIGRYGEGETLSLADAMTQHIDVASEYGVNFFIFDFNVMLDSITPEIYTDSNTVANVFLASQNSSKMNFALKFNLGFLGLSTSNRMYVNDSLFERLITAFNYMIPYFEASNYQKVENRYLVYLGGAADMYSDSTGNAPVYAELRNRMRSEGYELYILADQSRWSPAPRYETRFKDCIDALTMTDMAFTTEYETAVYLPQYIYLNWDYNKNFVETNWNADFVPQIQPAFTNKIADPHTEAFDFEGEEFFRTYCNVAKAHSNENDLIIINSFNDWTRNTQLEPSVNKSTLYLQVMKEEFKVN